MDCNQLASHTKDSGLTLERSGVNLATAGELSR